MSPTVAQLADELADHRQMVTEKLDVIGQRQVDHDRDDRERFERADNRLDAAVTAIRVDIRDGMSAAQAASERMVTRMMGLMAAGFVISVVAIVAVAGAGVSVSVPAIGTVSTIETTP